MLGKELGGLRNGNWCEYDLYTVYTYDMFKEF